MKYIIISTVIILWTFQSMAQAEEIPIAVDDANPPFMYKAEDGSAKGLYPFLLKTLFQRIKQPIRIYPLPWKRVLHSGKNGLVGIGGIYKTLERLKIFDYSDVLFEEKLYIYVQKGKSFAFKDMTDLRNKTIGIIRGWSYGDVFDHARQEQLFQVQENMSDKPNFGMLMMERIDCVLAIDLSAQRIILQNGYQNQIESIEPPLIVNPTYLVFAKKMNKKKLIEQFNATLQVMKQNKSYQKAIKNYLLLENTKSYGD